jgi:hypothetical protein
LVEVLDGAGVWQVANEDGRRFCLGIALADKFGVSEQRRVCFWYLLARNQVYKDLLAVGAKAVLVVICDRIGRTLGGLKLNPCLFAAVAVDFYNLVLRVEQGVDIARLGVVWEASYRDERALEVVLLGFGRCNGPRTSVFSCSNGLGSESCSADISRVLDWRDDTCAILSKALTLFVAHLGHHLLSKAHLGVGSGHGGSVGRDVFVGEG